MPRIAIIVPCRLEAARFPRKLLHPIRGKPLIRWVAERIASQAPELPLYFAVDDESLARCLDEGGFSVVLTRADHPTGTDRLAEANREIGADRVINVQGDEPLVSAGQIRLLSTLISGSAEMATLATRFQRAADFLHPNQVKVVCDRSGRALYFSRSPIPHGRDRNGPPDDSWLSSHQCYRHLGMYAYQRDLLERFSGLPRGQLEQLERLEQLRALENGYAIAVGFTQEPSIGIDSPEDVGRFEAYLDRS